MQRITRTTQGNNQSVNQLVSPSYRVRLGVYFSIQHKYANNRLYFLNLIAMIAMPSFGRECGNISEAVPPHVGDAAISWWWIGCVMTGG